MLNRNFIAVEMARHCPNPNAQSKLMCYDTPLVLWQVLRLAEQASNSPLGVIDSTSQLVASATSKLVEGGVSVARGTLVRKVCGPLLGRYAALCVSRRFSDADTQRDFIRSEAEHIFCHKFMRLLHNCNSREEMELIDPIAVYKLSEALNSPEAAALVSGRVHCADTTVKVIQLGRVLFA